MLMEKLCVLICVVWEPGWDLQVQCVGLSVCSLVVAVPAVLFDMVYGLW